MRCHADRSARDRSPTGPVLQRNASASRLPRADKEKEAEPLAGSGTGLSLAEVPIHAPAAEAADRTGLPARLKAGVERLSGFAMDDVRVHRDSPQPARLGALAFARGSDIHLAPGQERHLPHEAWHVVQQRQGRVPATANLDGSPLSDNAGLEAEADRMGGAAAEAPSSTAPGEVRRTGTGSRVVQRRVAYDAKVRKDLPAWEGAPEKSPYSEMLADFISRQDAFVMRSDCGLKDKVIHLLEERYYLLGERHGKTASKTWDESVLKWKHIPRMVEEDFVVAGFPTLEYKDPLGKEKKFKARGQSPFDSLAAQLMNWAVGTHYELTLINSMAKSWKSKRQAFETAMSVVALGFEQTYPQWLVRLPADLAPNAATKDAEKKKSADQFVAEYYEKLSVLKSDLHALGVATAYQEPEADESKSDFSADISDYFACVEKSRQFLPKMVEDLAGLLEMPAGELESVSTLLTPSKKSPNDALLTATSPARERAMMKNMEAVQPPAFIKTGYDHADAIAENEAFKDRVRMIPPGMLESATRRS